MPINDTEVTERPSRASPFAGLLAAAAAEPSSVISSLQGNYKEWAGAYDRSNAMLYWLLGEIYAAGPLFDSSVAAKEELCGHVSAIETVINAKRWYPREKQADELLVTFLLTLDSRQKVRKCQWLKCLRAAVVRGVERTSDAFVVWLTDVGGIIAAGHLTDPQRRTHLPTDAGGRLKALADELCFNEDVQEIDHYVAGDVQEGDLVVTVSRWGRDADGNLGLMPANGCATSPSLVLAVGKAVVHRIRKLENEQKRTEANVNRECKLAEAEAEAELNRGWDIKPESRKRPRKNHIKRRANPKHHKGASLEPFLVD